MDPDDAFKPWPTPERIVPGLRHRSWAFYVAVSFVVAVGIAGLALVAFIILAVIGLSRYGSNK